MTLPGVGNEPVLGIPEERQLQVGRLSLPIEPRSFIDHGLNASMAQENKRSSISG